MCGLVDIFLVSGEFKVSLVYCPCEILIVRQLVCWAQLIWLGKLINSRVYIQTSSHVNTWKGHFSEASVYLDGQMFEGRYYISMGLSKKDVTPVR